MARQIPRTVVVLGLVSFFTDVSSEMIYPLLPLFLSSVLGATAVQLGTIEGVAEATSALLKIVSGIWTDRARRRKPFVVAGYGLAGLVRPLIAFAQSWRTVLFIRFTDRIGKGLRSSPRDALIADSTAPEHRGAAYGFHRSMDHAGAVFGPLLAAALLNLAGVELRRVFLLASIPALIALGVAFFGIREAKPPAADSAGSGASAASAVTPDAAADVANDSGIHLLRDWKKLGGDYHRILLAFFVFTLGNSTDAFILVRLSQLGVSAGWIAGLWSLHHVVKMSSTYLCGRLSDRVSRKHLLLSGWAFFALVYAGFALASTTAQVVAVFLLYGIYYGLTEPVERAWVSDLVPTSLRGTAFGYFHAVTGLGALPASLFFGLIWQTYGAPSAFLLGAVLAAGAGLLLARVPSRRVGISDSQA